jgi:hypothetical protein
MKLTKVYKQNRVCTKLNQFTAINLTFYLDPKLVEEIETTGRFAVEIFSPIIIRKATVSESQGTKKLNCQLNTLVWVQKSFHLEQESTEKGFVYSESFIIYRLIQK